MTGLALIAFAGVLLLGRSAAQRRTLVGTARTSRPRSIVAAPDPLALAGSFDVLATALAGGLTVASAASAVASHAPEPLASVLRKAADLTVLGADPVTAWAHAQKHRETEALARLARRSARSGAAFASAIGEIADESRRDLANQAQARAERAGVLIAGPLGLCFLPAFVCLGIAPVVIGLGKSMDLGGLW